MSVVGGDLATRADLTALATKVDMAKLETRMTNRIYAVAVGQAALTITAVGILFRLMVGGE